MEESEAGRVQEGTVELLESNTETNIADRVDSSAIIDCVTGDRMAQVSKVDADLVGSSRLDLDLKRGKFTKPTLETVDRECLTTLSQGPHRHFDPTARIASDWHVDPPLFLLDRPIDQGSVEFANLA